MLRTGVYNLHLDQPNFSYKRKVCKDMWCKQREHPCRTDCALSGVENCRRRWNGQPGWKTLTSVWSPDWRFSRQHSQHCESQGVSLWVPEPQTLSSPGMVLSVLWAVMLSLVSRQFLKAFLSFSLGTAHCKMWGLDSLTAPSSPGGGPISLSPDGPHRLAKEGTGRPSVSCYLFKLPRHPSKATQPRAPADSLCCPRLALHFVLGGWIVQRPLSEEFDTHEERWFAFAILSCQLALGQI